MTSVTFLLSKDPEHEHGGDIALSRVVMDIARENFDVRAVCLSGHGVGPNADGTLTRVAKPAVSARSLAWSSLVRRRSLCHVRYDVDDLVDAVNATSSDIFFAEHSYMAEAFLRSRHRGQAPFVINTVNPESSVWKLTRGTLGRIEAPRIVADELRVAREADALGGYDLEEAQYYRAHGVPGARWIDLTLPPGQPAYLQMAPPRLVFMGTRGWPPNQEAFLEALRLWPEISKGIAGAELCVIGAAKYGATPPPLPDGVRDLGFVDDISALLSTCRALIAPVRTGGGVRVKLLDSASIGLPVVGTSAAIGSLGPVFGMTPYDDDAEFVARCREFLLDADLATKEGQRLYDANAARWQDRVPHRAVEGLIRREAPSASH
ncbi:glycosyltransferase [Gordonia sp. NPDC003504]